MTYDRRKGSERQQLVVRLRHSGMTFGEIGRRLGITWGGASALYNRAGFGTADPLPPQPKRVWCTQCERNVRAAEGEQCSRQFCKAKAVAA